MADPYRAILTKLLVEAGQVALDSFRTAQASLKSDGTQVSDADLKCEELLVRRLEEAFPGCGVVSEEGSRISGTNGTWHVDPIDGTSAYLEGLAHWGPTVCLVRDGKLEVGALWLPRLGEMYYACRGGGAWRNETRLVAKPARAIGRHDSVFLPSRVHRAVPLPWPGKVRALGSSAAHLALVAAGAGPAAVIPDWKLWDVGCGILMLEEAGLAVCDAKGATFDVLSVRPGLPFLAGASTALSLLTDDGWAGRALR